MYNKPHPERDTRQIYAWAWVNKKHRIICGIFYLYNIKLSIPASPA